MLRKFAPPGQYMPINRENRKVPEWLTLLAARDASLSQRRIGVLLAKRLEF
jgi:hypothetical protein